MAAPYRASCTAAGARRGSRSAGALARALGSGAAGYTCPQETLDAREAMGREPEPQQVTAPRRVTVSLVRLTGMQDPTVVQQLDVARGELHLQVEGRVVGDRLEKIHGFELLVRQPRRGRVALGVADVPTEVEDPRHAVHVAEHREREVGSLARRLLVVAVPRQWLIQHVDEVGTATEHLVVHRAGADDPALPAGPGPEEAQQPDEVRAVGVEVLPGPGAVQTRAGIAGVHTLVADVTEQARVGILSDRGTELRTEPAVRQLRLRLVEEVDREPPEQEEPARLGESSRPVRDPRADRRQHQGVPVHHLGRGPGIDGPPRGRNDLRALSVGELDGPFGRIGDVVWLPDGGIVQRRAVRPLSLIHISEPTRRTPISYAV